MSIVGSQALKEWFVEDDFFNSHYQHNWTPLSLANGWPIIRRFGSFFFWENASETTQRWNYLCEKPHYLIWGEKPWVEQEMNSLLVK